MVCLSEIGHLMIVISVSVNLNFVLDVPIVVNLPEITVRLSSLFSVHSPLLYHYCSAYCFEQYTYRLRFKNERSAVILISCRTIVGKIYIYLPTFKHDAFEFRLI